MGELKLINRLDEIPVGSEFIVKNSDWSGYTYKDGDKLMLYIFREFEEDKIFDVTDKDDLGLYIWLCSSHSLKFIRAETKRKGYIMDYIDPEYFPKTGGIIGDKEIIGIRIFIYSSGPGTIHLKYHNEDEKIIMCSEPFAIEELDNEEISFVKKVQKFILGIDMQWFALKTIHIVNRLI